MIFTLALARVAIVNSISTTGEELVTIQTELEEYKRKNEILKEKYLQESSLIHLEEKAEKFGFVEAKSQINLSAPLPLARN